MSSGWHKWYQKFFETVKENENTFRIALKTRLPLSLYNVLNDAFSPKDKEGYYAHIAKEASFYAVMNDWLNNGMQESPKEMAELCKKILDIRSRTG